ncbi:succinate dehydrogenase, hydrophobic membrane anchor protein [Neorickettsia sennetsu]|uniref:Succinate dehydrogenase hydrophobic membrane anchor subunit n=1 Tax=Ehrlichia sennetsu (strain ATCC VR-367 / Miyayama) TaxID=222891 RepID=Q2GEZ7_EHRS3|nr:succinate dehydrogenase, hydrophobic membrane anchor protein [Neorickettsia sennetsu]ABD45697.1 putative succinate dehydrogenase, hydrophobic membrane anchor protein [Neorickettsia sennetsu str. Miyayama]
MRCVVRSWLAQRITALLLFLLFIFLLFSLRSSKWIFPFDVEYLSCHWGVLLVFAMFVLIAQCHALLGLNVIIEDYIASSILRKVLVSLNIIFVGSTLFAFVAVFYRLFF